MEVTSLVRGDTEEYIKALCSQDLTMYDPLTPIMPSPQRLAENPSGDDMFASISGYLELPSPSPPVLRRNTRRGQSTELSSLIQPLPLQDDITDLLPISPVDTTAKGNGGRIGPGEDPFGEEGQRIFNWFRNTSATIMTRSKSAELRRRFEQACNNNSPTTFTGLLNQAGKPPESSWSADLKRTLNLRKVTWPTPTPTQAPVTPTKSAFTPEEAQHESLDSRVSTPPAGVTEAQPPAVIPPATFTPEAIPQALPITQVTASQTTSQASLKTKTHSVARHVVSPNCPIHGHLAQKNLPVTGGGNGKSGSAGAHSGLGPRTPGHAVALSGGGGGAAIPGATVESAGGVLSGAGGSPPRSLVTGSAHCVESNSDAQTSLAKRALENGDKPVDQPPRKRPSLLKGRSLVTENVAEQQQGAGSTGQVPSTNYQSSLERTESITADNIVGNKGPENKGRTNAEEKKKLRQERLKRRIEAKERCPNCAKGIPETLVDARKKISELENQLSGQKRYQEFMNRMDSENTKVIDELKDKEKALLAKIKKLEQKVKDLGGSLEDSD